MAVYGYATVQPWMPSSDRPANRTSYFTIQEKFAIADRNSLRKDPDIPYTMEHANGENSKAAMAGAFRVPPDLVIGRNIDFFVHEGNLMSTFQLFPERFESDMLRHSVRRGEEWGVSGCVNCLVDDEVTGEVYSKTLTHIGITRNPLFKHDGTGSMIHELFDSYESLEKHIYNQHVKGNPTHSYVPPITRERLLLRYDPAYESQRRLIGRPRQYDLAASGNVPGLLPPSNSESNRALVAPRVLPHTPTQFACISTVALTLVHSAVFLPFFTLPSFPPSPVVLSLLLMAEQANSALAQAVNNIVNPGEATAASNTAPLVQQQQQQQVPQTPTQQVQQQQQQVVNAPAYSEDDVKAFHSVESEIDGLFNNLASKPDHEKYNQSLLLKVHDLGERYYGALSKVGRNNIRDLDTDSQIRLAGIAQYLDGAKGFMANHIAEVYKDDPELRAYKEQQMRDSMKNPTRLGHAIDVMANAQNKLTSHKSLEQRLLALEASNNVLTANNKKLADELEETKKSSVASAPAKRALPESTPVATSRPISTPLGAELNAIKRPRIDQGPATPAYNDNARMVDAAASANVGTAAPPSIESGRPQQGSWMKAMLGVPPPNSTRNLYQSKYSDGGVGMAANNDLMRFMLEASNGH